MNLFCLSEEGENYDKICGQILFTTKGRLAYYCTFCGKYRNYEAFITHLLEDCCKFLDDDLKVCITKPKLMGGQPIYFSPLPESQALEEYSQQTNLQAEVVELEQSQTTCKLEHDFMQSDKLLIDSFEGDDLVKCEDSAALENGIATQAKVTDSIEEFMSEEHELLKYEELQVDELIIEELEEAESTDGLRCTNRQKNNEKTNNSEQEVLINYEDLTVLAVGEKYAPSDEIKQSDENTNYETCDAGHEQTEYCEENFEEYINVECLEDEDIYDQSQTSHQIDESEQASEYSSLNSIEADFQYNYKSSKRKLTKPTNKLTKSSNFKNEEKIKKTEIIKCKEFDIPFVVRNVRRLKKFHPSHIAPEERKFECPVCNLTFKDRSNMNYHLKRHTNLKSYSCPDCDKKFYTSSEVRLHSRVHKKPAKKFLCTQCGKAFETNYLLSEHTKRHTNQRDYVCQICEKGFFQLGTLKKHMLSHSSERSHSCSVCEATFKHTSGLKYHMKQHDNKREYKCKLCDVAFNIQYGLNVHMKMKHKKEIA